MYRRTFLKGAAASIATVPFGAAFAQGQSAQPVALPPTIIYNEQANELEEQRVNPLVAPPEILRKYGLPRPPSPSAPAYPIWRDMFSRELEYRSFEITQVESLYRTNPRFQQIQAAITTRYESSPNWSGAYVHPRDGNMLVEVMGSWRIPAISMPGGLSGVLPPACSIWVGLDGQRRYVNSSLPQIGTRLQFRPDGTTEIYGWSQWWVRDQPSPATIPPIPISLNQGDWVLCFVQAVAASEATVTMIKLGLGFEFWSKNIVPGWPSPVLNPPVISGATAEWVVERPTLLGTEELHMLPHFDPVEFTLCAAEEATDINPPNSVTQNLHGARFIELYESLDGPERISVLSKPQEPPPNDPFAFEVRYIG